MEASRIPSHKACNRSAGKRCARNDLTAACAIIEIFKDHARVVVRRAVFRNQDRNLAEWILLTERAGRIHRVGCLDFHIVVETEQRQCDLYFAPERRRRRGAEDHHGGAPFGFHSSESSGNPADTLAKEHTPAANHAAGFSSAPRSHAALSLCRLVSEARSRRTNLYGLSASML